MARPVFVAMLICLTADCVRSSAHGQEPAPSWKAGAASQVITPKKNVWLAGYAKRTKATAGKVQELFAKALALEDRDGQRAVILTLDLIGITRPMRDDVARQVEKKFGLTQDRLLVNASHTHCSPLIRGQPSVIYDLSAEQWADVDEYLAELPGLLVQVVGAALKDLQPAQLSYTHARAGFAMNRRLPTSKGYENSPFPDGPVDHDVPVLRVEDPKGKLRALLFGYACHNTTLQFEYFCGDYAGYAQEYLEQDHPGVTALFMAGCGGDQNPFPRGKLDHAKQHGRALANAVEAALLPRPRPVAGPLRIAFAEATLQFMPLSREELVKLGMSKTIYDVRRSKLLLAELEKNGQLKSTHPYPIHVLQFGSDLTLIALAGEVVVDFSIRLKKEITGSPLWVAGYSNDVFGYVPSVRVQKEGGYEPVGSTLYSTLPGPLAQSTEERIVSKVTELAGRVRTTPEELWNAARKGDAAAVKSLLAKGVDVNAKTDYGATALSFAADKGHVEVIRALLAAKADVNVKDTFYNATPLTWAISKGHAEIVKLLVEAGAADIDPVLLSAAQSGDVVLAQAALKNGKFKAATLDRALAATPKAKTELAELLTKAGAKMPAAPANKDAVKVDAEALKSYVGAYRNDEHMSLLNFVLLSDRLQVKAGAIPLYILTPLDASRFQPAGNDTITITFARDKDKVTGFTQKSGAVEIAYKRIVPRAGPAAPSDDAPVAVKAPGNWPSFRGTNAAGVADGQAPPITWDAAAGRNVRWRTPIAGLGHSCPVVWQDKIFITTAVSSGDKAGLKTGLYGNVDSVMDTSPHTFRVLCLDKATGKIVWDQVAHEGVPRVKRHTKATHANSTCATDGVHVVACFGSEGLYCYDLAGRRLWKQDLGVLESGWFYDADYQWGYGSSPIIYRPAEKGSVPLSLPREKDLPSAQSKEKPGGLNSFRPLAIIQCDAGKNSFVAAFDLKTGARVWSTPRDEVPSWGTPTVIESRAGAELVTNATKFVRGYDPLTGKELWRLGRNSEISVPTPFFAHDLIFVSSGYRLPRPIYAIRPGARGDITLAKGETASSAIAWSTDKGGTYMPTPIVYGDHLYTCSTDGVVTCYDARKGKRLWWERLGSDAGFTASPVAADGRIYFTSEDGQTYVLKAGTQFELLATNALGDPCLATPAIADGMMLVRTQRFLFALGRQAPKQ